MRLTVGRLMVRLTVGRPTLLKCWPTPVLFCQMIELNLKRETLRWTISILDIYIYTLVRTA